MTRHDSPNIPKDKATPAEQAAILESASEKAKRVQRETAEQVYKNNNAARGRRMSL